MSEGIVPFILLSFKLKVSKRLVNILVGRLPDKLLVPTFNVCRPSMSPIDGGRVPKRNRKDVLELRRHMTNLL